MVWPFLRPDCLGVVCFACLTRGKESLTRADAPSSILVISKTLVTVETATNWNHCSRSSAEGKDFFQLFWEGIRNGVLDRGLK